MKEIIIGNLAKLASKRLLAWLVAKAPFFGFAIVNPIVSFLINYLATKLFEKAYLGAMLVVIRIDANIDKNAMESLLEEIRSIDRELTEEEMHAFDERLAKAGDDLYRINIRG